MSTRSEIASGKSECALCGKFEDERNILEQIDKPLCNSCYGMYDDEELRDELDHQNKLTWEDYYRYLDIPDEWENVSYGNDELPSFSHNGYQIWINHPTLEGRQQAYLGIGYKDLSEFEDWRFSATYERDYGNGIEFSFQTMYFNEVIDFVNKPTLYGLVGILEEHTNYKLNISKWRDEEVIKFIKDLLNGKTEYYLDDTFPKQTFINFINNIGEK
jgi:hypothetical protein